VGQIPPADGCANGHARQPPRPKSSALRGSISSKTIEINAKSLFLLVRGRGLEPRP